MQLFDVQVLDLRDVAQNPTAAQRRVGQEARDGWRLVAVDGGLAFLEREVESPVSPGPT